MAELTIIPETTLAPAGILKLDSEEMTALCVFLGKHAIHKRGILNGAAGRIYQALAGSLPEQAYTYSSPYNLSQDKVVVGALAIVDNKGNPA